MKSILKYYFIKLVASRLAITKLYYFLGSKFDAELKAVVYGRYVYFYNDRKNHNIPKLRRDVHRIEKGLVMVPRKEIFGLNYIVGLVDNLICLDSIYDETMGWATSVLSDYFEVTSSEDAGYLQAREKFISFCESMPNLPFNFKPQEKSIVENEAIPSLTSEFNHLVSCRRSVRHFNAMRVDRSLIDESIVLAMQSPSACNRLPYRFSIIDDPAIARDVARCAGGTAGFVGSINNIAVLIGDFSNYMYEVDRRAPYIDGSLSAMTLIYAFEARGISSVCINWHDQPDRVKNISKLIELKKSECVIMLIAFGYRLEGSLSPFSAKKNIEEVRTYEV